MIQVNTLRFAFGKTPLFSDLDFSIKSGEIFSIIGPNGCGKSTLLKLMRGNLNPIQGDILWDGIPVTAISSAKQARQVAVVPQSTHIEFPYKVKDVVAMGRYPHRKNLLNFSTQDDMAATQQAMALTDIAHLSERTVTLLSGGELQRVFIARALAQSTQVLFLDEATSHLDIDHRLEISELLLRLNKEQETTIVQVSHDLDMAAAISDKILLLNEHGEKIAVGPPDQVMTAETLHQVFRVHVRVERNPLTGTPMILPLINRSIYQLNGLKIHLFCGGGSGSSLMRKLHLAGAEITTGPLNRGDADEALARALNLPYAIEEPFCPYSEACLATAAQQVNEAAAVIVATRWWGQGNLGYLTLAQKALDQGADLFLVSDEPADDFTQGTSSQLLQQLKEGGAKIITSEDSLMQHLSNLALS